MMIEAISQVDKIQESIGDRRFTIQSRSEMELRNDCHVGSTVVLPGNGVVKADG